MSKSIHIKPENSDVENGVITRISAQKASWQYLNMELSTAYGYNCYHIVKI